MLGISLGNVTQMAGFFNFILTDQNAFSAYKSLFPIIDIIPAF